VNFFLGKPKSHPADWVIRHPIWTTWAKYKTNISDQIVTEFAEDVANHGFTGQIEIDDYWEVSTTFKLSHFIFQFRRVMALWSSTTTSSPIFPPLYKPSKIQASR